MRSAALDPRLLITLATIVREGSFAAAADELHITPSAVSQQITELERNVGRPVLRRRPLALTQVGQVLVDASMHVTGALARAQHQIGALDAGEIGMLRVGAFTSATAGPVAAALAGVRSELPGVTIRLVQAEPPECYAALLQGELDIAVTYVYPQSPRPRPEGIDVRTIAVDDFVAAVPADHRFARRRSIDLADLHDEDFIGTPLTRLPFPWPGESRPRTENLGVTFRGEDYTTTLRLVRHGLGVALLPRLVAADAPAGVRILPLRGRPWYRHILEATAHDQPETGPVTVMRRHLVEALVA